MSNLLSVGIDIGTCTTQIIFSCLTVEDTSGYFAVPHLAITRKSIIHESAIYPTPLLSGSLIDGDAIRIIVDTEYRKANICASDIDTGAIIITGEAARKENAAYVMAKLSDYSGSFVVSTAGPDLEAIIAGKGSGAHAYSLTNSCVTTNLDIGGGTTNVVTFDVGEVVSKGCVNIGGGLIKVSTDLDVEYVSPVAEILTSYMGTRIRVGEKASYIVLSSLANLMAGLLEQLMGLSDRTALFDSIATIGSSKYVAPKTIDKVFFSGGVADCIHRNENEDFQYGDIGILLGRAIRESKLLKMLPAQIARDPIRATVIGAGAFTTSISGSTIACNSMDLPIKNVPVLSLTSREQDSIFCGEEALLRERVEWFLDQVDSSIVVLSMPGKVDPTYREIKNAASSITRILSRLLPPSAPIIVVIQADIGKALGNAIRSALKEKRSVICLDCLKLEFCDYLDIGKPMINGMVVPVVIKTIILG